MGLSCSTCHGSVVGPCHDTGRCDFERCLPHVAIDRFSSSRLVCWLRLAKSVTTILAKFGQGPQMPLGKQSFVRAVFQPVERTRWQCKPVARARHSRLQIIAVVLISIGVLICWGLRLHARFSQGLAIWCRMFGIHVIHRQSFRECSAWHAALSVNTAANLGNPSQTNLPQVFPVMFSKLNVSVMRRSRPQN